MHRIMLWIRISIGRWSLITRGTDPQAYIHEVPINFVVLERSHSSSCPPPPPKKRTMDAPAPFDSSAISDTIIRTYDNIHFYVLGALLYYVSPTFRDKLSLNRGLENKGKLPVIDFQGDSKIFNILLELIYPRVDELQLRDLDIFRRASKAAQAYSMSVVEKKLKKQIMTSSFIQAEPFRSYTIAIDLGWEEVALVAARATLQIPLKELVFIDELRDISGAEFYRFLDYRLQCEDSRNVSEVKFTKLTRLPSSGQSAGAQGHFVASSNGNLILRSSDLVDFFVIEGLIRFVSPFFDGKFPLKEHEEVDGRPVIIVPERSEVLRGLLNLIYPGEDDPGMPDCRLWGEMVRAARKLEIATAEKKLEKQGMALAYREPLRMYAVASSLDFVEMARIAALNTLSQPLKDRTFVDELDQITGADLFRLMRFRFNCAGAVRKVIKDSNAHTKHGLEHLRIQSHRRHTGDTKHLSSAYMSSCTACLLGLSDKLYQKLEDCPRGDTYRAICVSDVVHRLGFPNPSQCSINISAFNTIEKYRDGLAAAIEDAVSKVCST